MRRGSITQKSVYAAIAISALSSAALLAWASWSDNFGVGEQMLKSLNNPPKLLLLTIGVPFFACLNAFAEEVIYRGVLQEAALKSGFAPSASIVLQGMAFASIHFAAGFPNGWMGYVMTLVYGTTLGVLRQKSRGMLLPYLTLRQLASDLQGPAVCVQPAQILLGEANVYIPQENGSIRENIFRQEEATSTESL